MLILGTLASVSTWTATVLMMTDVQFARRLCSPPLQTLQTANRRIWLKRNCSSFICRGAGKALHDGKCGRGFRAPAREGEPMAIATINPATGERVRSFEPLREEQIEAKLQRAAETFREYRRMPFPERARRMTRAAEILEAEKEAFGRLMTTEMGKPVKAAVEEAAKCALGCRFYAENAARFLADEVVETPAMRSFVRYQPLGPVLAIMPWNFPFWQVFRFAAPALMAGNVGLLKHASNVPQCALAIEEIFRRAGFPEGVFQTLLIGSAGPCRDADRQHRGGQLGGKRGGQTDQEDGPRAGRQRPLRCDAQCRPGRSGADGGAGADDQQRAVLHRRQTVHRR
jgi:Aldehyde dehydrogenase family